MRVRSRRRNLTPAQIAKLEQADAIDVRERIIRCGCAVFLAKECGPDQSEYSIVQSFLNEAMIMARDSEAMRDSVWKREPRKKKVSK